MRIRRALVPLLVVVAMALLALAGVEAAQAQRRGGAGQAPAGGGAQRPAAQVHATLNQVMRGILFINSNIIFAAQSTNPATIKPAGRDASTATDALESIYGGWQAVENAGLMLAEAANLLIVPGRMCSNGKPVPLQNADWPKFVQGLREAGMATYKAAQNKSEDAILEATDTVATACANCHEVYRDKTPQQGGNAARCMQ